MKRVHLFLLLSISICFVNNSHAQGVLYFEDLEKFKLNNPDGKKYEFVSTYIDGLNYLYLNRTRKDRIEFFDDGRLKEAEKVNKIMDNLVLDNLNLRIARNMVKKFRIPQNGLILKAADLFVQVCNEQIVFNNRQRKKFVDLYRVYKEEEVGSFDKKAFLSFQRNLGAQRKESLKKLLEASYIVSKALISNEEDEYGDLMRLGITSGERRKLLRKLDVFRGPQFEGEVREGQNFLEASITILRQNLEDYTWASLDE